MTGKGCENTVQKVLNSNRRNTVNPANANITTEGQLRSRRKAAKMLVAVVVMFAICYLPVHLLSILRYTMEIPQNHTTVVIAMLSHWLCYANSAVNPIIYNFMSGKFRLEFKRAFLQCRCFGKPHSSLHVATRSLANRSTLNSFSPQRYKQSLYRRHPGSVASTPGVQSSRL